MPDIAGVLNLEVRLPLTEGPGFLKKVFVELEDEGTVAIGVAGERGVYAYARITQDEWFRINEILFSAGAPEDADDEVRRGCD